MQRDSWRLAVDELDLEPCVIYVEDFAASSPLGHYLPVPSSYDNIVEVHSPLTKMQDSKGNNDAEVPSPESHCSKHEKSRCTGFTYREIRRYSWSMLIAIYLLIWAAMFARSLTARQFTEICCRGDWRRRLGVGEGSSIA